MGTVNQEKQLERIADALERIESDITLIEEHLDDLSRYVGYVPPRGLMGEGYSIFRIGGSVDTGTY